MLKEVLAESHIPSYVRNKFEVILDEKIGGHFSTLRTKINDPEILIKTLRDLGLTVK